MVEEIKENNPEVTIVKINTGIIPNLIVLLLLFGLAVLLFIAQVNDDIVGYLAWSNFILANSLTLIFIFFPGILVHGLIKLIIYKSWKVKNIKFMSKKSVFFLYSDQPLTIKQAKILWLTPFLICLILGAPLIILNNFGLSLAVVMLILSITDDLLMYWHLNRFNNDDLFIQNSNYFGFQCIRKK